MLSTLNLMIILLFLLAHLYHYPQTVKSDLRKKKTITEEVTRTEIVFEKGKYIQQEITETITREVEEPLFEEVDLYDAAGKNITGKHHVPVLETYEEEIDLLDENGQPILVGSGEFVTRERPKLNPEYDESKKYVSREDRPEWTGNSKFDRIIARIKNNPVLASLIVLGTIIIALSTFTDALKKLAALIPEPEPPAPIDISGRWRADATDEIPVIYFNFRTVGDKLFGSVLLPWSFEMQRNQTGILDGKIIGDSVSFTTKHEYVKKYGRPNPVTGDVTPDVMAESISHYRGKIQGYKIHFELQKESGYYTEFTAMKIIDLTETSPPGSESKPIPSRKVDTYTLIYTLPGHEGGIRSLSFGPDKGVYPSGGLRLASGGAVDGLIKFWDTATAELHGSDDFMEESQKDGPVYLAYKRRTRKRLVDLLAVNVSKDGHTVYLYGKVFYPNSTAAGSVRTKKLPGVAGSVAISADLRLVATTETDDAMKSTIKLWFTFSGNLERALACSGVV